MIIKLRKFYQLNIQYKGACKYLDNKFSKQFITLWGLIRHKQHLEIQIKKIIFRRDQHELS